jgi:hypothetical protein
MLANRMMMAAAGARVAVSEDIGGIDEYTKLMLHMDGTDDGTSFIDSSASNHTITPVADAKTEDTQKKFGVTSGYFDGTGDYLTVPDSEDWDFGAGDFTIDFWTYSTVAINTGISDIRVILCLGSTGLRVAYGCGKDSGWGEGIKLFAWCEDGYSISDTCTINVNTWNHFGIVRISGLINFYLNGNLVSSHSHSADYTYTGSDPLYIGRQYEGSWEHNGYIDELRISKGIARWTENFTPPVVPYSVPIIGGNDAYTKLLLHMDGTDDGTTFTDDSASSHTVTRYNALTKTSVKQLGTASGYFDGSGDYLTVPTSDDWDFGSGDFTIDSWIYPTGEPETGQIGFLVHGVTAGGDYSFLIYTRHVAASPNNFYMEVKSDSNYYLIASSAAHTLNEWQHIALVRNGNTLTFYKNGTAAGTADLTGITLRDVNQPVSIGWDTKVDGNFFIGHIDELRISKGIARWTENFTPPASPYTISS